MNKIREKRKALPTKTSSANSLAQRRPAQLTYHLSIPTIFIFKLTKAKHTYFDVRLVWAFSSFFSSHYSETLRDLFQTSISIPWRLLAKSAKLLNYGSIVLNKKISLKYIYIRLVVGTFVRLSFSFVLIQDQVSVPKLVNLKAITLINTILV